MEKGIIRKKLLELKELREQRIVYDDEYTEKVKQLDEECKEVVANLDNVLKEIRNVESELRDYGEVYFEETGEKEFYGMTVSRKLNVPSYDKDKAIAYCIERKDAKFLTLAKAKFDAAAKVLEPEFVTFSDKIMVSVPKKIEVGEE